MGCGCMKNEPSNTNRNDMTDDMRMQNRHILMISTLIISTLLLLYITGCDIIALPMTSISAHDDTSSADAKTFDHLTCYTPLSCMSAS